MLLRAALTLLILATLVAPSQAAPRPPAAPVQAGRLGVHMLLSEGYTPWPWRAWRDHLTLASQAVGPGGYVLQVLSDGNRDPARWQAFMAGARNNRLRPIVRLA